MKHLRSWEIPNCWSDTRRWVPTICANAHGGTINYGGREGDLAGRMVAVANGRWFALPFLRAGETADFLEKLFAFAIDYGIRLEVWRHPLYSSHAGSVAQLIRRSTDWAICPECRGYGYLAEQTDVDCENRYDCRTCGARGEIQVAA